MYLNPIRGIEAYAPNAVSGGEKGEGRRPTTEFVIPGEVTPKKVGGDKISLSEAGREMSMAMKNADNQAAFTSSASGDQKRLPQMKRLNIYV